jgi:hypothetical protein
MTAETRKLLDTVYKLYTENIPQFTPEHFLENKKDFDIEIDPNLVFAGTTNPCNAMYNAMKNKIVVHDKSQLNNTHTITHEGLHLCAAKRKQVSFNFVESGYGKQIYNSDGTIAHSAYYGLNEGVTELLTRSALKEPNLKNYVLEQRMCSILTRLCGGYVVYKFYFMHHAIDLLTAHIHNYFGETKQAYNIFGNLDAYTHTREVKRDEREACTHILPIQNALLDLFELLLKKFPEAHNRNQQAEDFEYITFRFINHGDIERPENSWEGHVARMLDRTELEKFSARVEHVKRVIQI